MWADMPDPIGGRTELVEGDSEGNALEQALTAWKEAFGLGSSKAITNSDVIDKQDFYPELTKALSVLCNCDPKKLDARTLGYALKANMRRTAGNLRFNHAKKGKKGAPWFVELVGQG